MPWPDETGKTVPFGEYLLVCRALPVLRDLPVLPGKVQFRLIFTLALIFCLSGAAQAQQSSTAAKFVTIPIYYVTDRELKGDTFGNRRRYKSQCQHQMYYGTAMMTVPNKKNKILDDRLKALGWQSADRHGKKVSPKD